jgi:GNAT superfamily N-acetyltransferase
MSVPDTAVSTRPSSVPFVRDAVPADYPAIRDVVIAAYRQYADLIAPDIFSRYLADLLDLETHASHGPLLVVEADEGVCGFAAFYPDASVQGFGWPSAWASGRALAVHPATRGHGVARVLIAAIERLARDSGAPVFAFHTVSFMTSAIALYERLGYRRAPEFDFDWAARFGRSAAAPITAIAYLRHLTRCADMSMACDTPAALPTPSIRNRGTTNDHDIRHPGVVRPRR